MTSKSGCAFTHSGHLTRTSEYSGYRESLSPDVPPPLLLSSGLQRELSSQAPSGIPALAHHSASPPAASSLHFSISEVPQHSLVGGLASCPFTSSLCSLHTRAKV